MFRRTSPASRGRDPRRRGAILLVVLTMLALFAVIGLSFVLYAESEANASRIAKEAVGSDLSPPETSGAVNAFLEQMAYQTDKRESALWGKELARLMYGDAQLAPDRTSAYKGVGVYSEFLKLTSSGMPNIHRSEIVRFGQHPSFPNVNILPDQTYADPTYDYNTAPGAALTLKYVGRDAAYTYPDRNNIFVAVQDPATGRIVKPSYHARSAFRSLQAASPPAPNQTFWDLEYQNVNWYTPQGYFRVLRPRTIDNLTGPVTDPASEMAYIKGVIGWPVPANLTEAQAINLYKILSGNDPAAPTSFQRAFPFVAPNPDGSTTGDLPNVRYGEGQQTADSVWLDLKLPTIPYRGRRLQPMVAATVLPLDRGVNHNVAGSNKTSGQGFGPAEVSLLKILQSADPTAPAPAAANLVSQRYRGGAVPSPNGSSNTLDFFHPDPSAPTTAANATYPPSYAPVDFSGVGAGPPSAPTLFSTSYTYPAATYNSGSGSSAYTQPPLFYNPFQWNPYVTAGGAGNTFPMSDERYLSARYSEKDKYAKRRTFLGQFPVAMTPNREYGDSTPMNPMNRVRALLTPMSNRLSRPGLAPMAIGNISGNPANLGAPSLVLNPGTTAPVLAEAATPGTALLGPAFDLSASKPLTSTAVGGDITGSTTASAANLRAFLQGVDLNRPLADYRDPLTRPTVTTMAWPFVPGPNAAMPGTMPAAPTTVTPNSCAQAAADRQALATDIFTRLCVALNARVYYSGGVLTLPQPSAGAYSLTGGGTTWTVQQPEYDALRWVAQLSANIVDAIDPDDVSTAFVWNPTGTGPTDATNFALPAPGGINDRVVFGVEKPKLLVNEVYAELANKQSDYTDNKVPGGGNFSVRFFVELLNPSNAEPAAGGADQSARNGGNASLQFAASGISCYRLEVYEKGLTTHNQLADRTNPNYVLGRPPTTSYKLQSNFTAGVTCNAGVAFTEQVEPNGGAFTATAGARNGFCVVGPALDPNKAENAPAVAYAPQTGTAGTLDNLMLLKATTGTQDQLEYDVPATKPDDITPNAVTPLNATELHAVLLQRLANPYLAESATNPYVTVDYMAGVEVFDAVRVGTNAGMTKGARAPVRDAGENYSMGRAQPYAGFQSQAAMTAPVTVLTTMSAGMPPLGQTLTVLQNPQPPPATTTPHNTFFRHNSTNPPAAMSPLVPQTPSETLIHPFSEPFQPDRRLINPLEILHVSMAPSHLLTRNFATPNGATPSFYQQELSRAALPTPPTAAPPLLYRALDVLNVKPWTYGVPHGGRTPGGVNINLINDDVGAAPTAPMLAGDSAVFSAVLDRQPANFFTDADVNLIWKNLRASRSPNWTTTVPAVGATVDEWDAATGAFGTDRPFRGLGVGQYDTSAGGMASAQGLESTLLRSASPPTGTPLFFNAAQTDPYRQAEPLRKAYNNFTTVSDNYLVVFTVGFFEIVEDKSVFPTRIVLRREAYEQVPGDLRSQFTAVIDRTGLAVNAANPTDGQTGRFAQAAAATGVEPLTPRVAGGSTFNRYRVRFPVDGTSISTALRLRDMPTGSGSLFGVMAGTTIRLGSGPTAANFVVTEMGGVFNSGGAPADPRDISPANAYDAAAGLGTVTVEAPAGAQQPVCAAGDLISLPDNEFNAGANTVFVPGNPGRPGNFSPTNSQFRGVVRYFGRMQP